MEAGLDATSTACRLKWSIQSPADFRVFGMTHRDDAEADAAPHVVGPTLRIMYWPLTLIHASDDCGWVSTKALDVAPRSAASASVVFLRPIANPLALGFIALAGATLVLAGQELSWIPDRQSFQVAVIILISAPLLQLIGSVFGFLARDAVAATGMGLLAVTWAVIGAVHIILRPSSHSQALGTFLLLVAVGLMLIALAASEAKTLPAVVMGLAAIRFFVTGLFELLGIHAIQITAGAVGCLLTVVAVYTTFALELEGVRRRAVLPTLRRGLGKQSLSNDFAEQVRTVAAEPGVRRQL